MSGRGKKNGRLNFNRPLEEKVKLFLVFGFLLVALGADFAFFGCFFAAGMFAFLFRFDLGFAAGFLRLFFIFSRQGGADEQCERAGNEGQRFDELHTISLSAGFMFDRLLSASCHQFRGRLSPRCVKGKFKQGQDKSLGSTCRYHF